MSAPFASKLFENSGNNTDGWDEWDWVDNNNASNVTKEQPQSQFIHQSPVIGYTQTQSIQSQFIDNAPNNFNLTVSSSPLPPPPIVDQSFQAEPLNSQLNATLPNNNHLINASGLHQDDNVPHYQQAQSQQQQQQQLHQQQSISYSSSHNANNNFVQSSTPIYPLNPSPGSHIESNENAVPSLPPVPARSSFSIDQSEIQNQKTDIGLMPFSNTPPPPPTSSQNQPSTSATDASSSPMFNNNNNSLPPVLPPPSLNQSPFANTNPFKRVGSHAHRTPPPPPIQSNSNLNATPPPPPNTFSNQSQRALHSQQDSIESITHNDRNEYLQTGHLSEDGENNVNPPLIENHTPYSSSDGNGDSLPPPGLSRLVLGEPETSESSNTQPPPGLDRLVTGTEVSQPNINLERQADGQDNTDTKVAPIIRSNNQFTSVAPIPVATNLPPTNSTDDDNETSNFKSIPESDRNQYLVAGENVVDNNNISAPASILQNTNMQRVVTGLDVENLDKALPKNQRELDMDGENIEDQQQPHQNQNRFVNTTNTVSQADSVEHLDVSGNYNQKNPSNPSTGDDSDHEKTYYSRTKGPTNKKIEDRRKKRDESRYETEDTDHSTRERRRPKENERYMEKDRRYRGRSADVDENNSRMYRSEKVHRGEKYYRPQSRDDEDRYDERYR